MAALLGFIITAIGTRILTPTEYGKASMFLLILNVFMTLVIFGTDRSFVRFFYEVENPGELLYKCIRISIVLFLTLSCLVIIYSNPIAQFIIGDHDRHLVIMLLIGIISEVLYRYGILVIRMKQKATIYSIIHSANKLISLVLLIFLFQTTTLKYEVLILSTIISTMIFSIVSIIVEHKTWSLRNWNTENNKHTLKDIINYSYPLFFTALITWLFESVDKISLKQWSSFDELGLYSASFKVVGLLVILQTAFSTFWTPICYEKFEKEPNDREFFRKMTNIVSLVVFIIAVVTIQFKDVIVLVLGSEFIRSADIMAFLIFMPLMRTISETTVIGINFYKKTKWHILTSSISCIVNLLGNWILVPIYGGVGAAISTAFSFIIFFSLNTYISLMYYKVDYGLLKIYTVTSIIFIYSILSVFLSNLILIFFIGVILILAIISLYWRTISDVIGSRREE